MSKSAMSRRFVAATTDAMAELLEADLSGFEPAVLMIDGLNVAGEMIVVAPVISADSTKVPVGPRLGDTENATIVKDLLADLVARGLRCEHGILVMIDGAKALRTAVAEVFGKAALVQRRTLHKRRNAVITCRSPGARPWTAASPPSSPPPTRPSGSPKRNGNPVLGRRHRGGTSSTTP
jgi:hypothetical protein